jgi:hypothetical protein
MKRLLILLMGTVVSAAIASAAHTATERPDNRKLRSIFNNDINNILVFSSGKDTDSEEYQRAVYAILDMKPDVLAQNVGLPEAVIYRSSVATTFDKYLEEVSRLTWPESSGEDATRQSEALKTLFGLGTDPLTLTIEACRKRGVLVLASYRMNAEDWYGNTYLLSDFERAHPEWRIPGAGCLDPAVPQVYEHRMKIFTEVAERYDIDGIEFDFRRWHRMVSDPLKNHAVLTRMVRDTRQMLDAVAKKKGRRLILGVRVGPSLATDPSPFVYPGSYYPTKPVNASCRDLGLDVKTWIAEGLVDLVCPSLFLDGLPSLPKTGEFVALAKGTNAGIYPTLWSWPLWAHGEKPWAICEERPIGLGKKDEQALALYKDELCTTALRMYEDGADGISTFNWYSHIRNSEMPHRGTDSDGQSGAGTDAVQTYIYPLLKDPAALRRYRDEPWAVPPATGTVQPERVR